MLMFKKLPYFIYVYGKKYKINVDFRAMIHFEEELQDKSVSTADKIIKCLRLFCPAFFKEHNIYELYKDKKTYKYMCDKMIWFYMCGREKQGKKVNGKGIRQNQIYSYEYDDEYIYSAFLCEYNIDLSKDRVHWWKFKALLKGLKEDVVFNKIKSYRAYTGDDKNLKELKEFYKLPLPESEQKRLDDLYNALK